MECNRTMKIFLKNFRQLLLFETVRVGRRTNSRSTEPTEYCCKLRRKIETDQQTDSESREATVWNVVWQLLLIFTPLESTLL